MNKKPMLNFFSATGGFFLLLAVAFSGCHKKDHHEPEEKWVNSTVDTSSNVGDTLAYFLPTAFTNGVPVISKVPTNGIYSALAQNPTTGDWIYYYSPREGFSGTDAVTIDSGVEKEDEEHHHHRPKIREGGCQKDNEKTLNRLTLNISVGGMRK